MHLSNTVFFFDRDFEIFTPLCVDMRRAALLLAQIDSGDRPPGTGDHTKAGLRLSIWLHIILFLSAQIDSGDRPPGTGDHT